MSRIVPGVMARLAASLLLWLGLLLVAGRPATAQDSAAFDLPGLQADADAFLTSLRQPYPAGAPESQLRQAAATADAAVGAGDWDTARRSLAFLIGASPHSVAWGWHTWLDLARAELGVAPPQPQAALEAAWFAFTSVDHASDTLAADQATALAVMATALAALDRPVPELLVLRAIVARRPDDAAARQRLAQRQQALGLLFRGVATDSEAFPARACLSFVGHPSSAPDFHPGDWVSLTPSRHDVAVTLESGRICLTGLPAGATTTVTLRQGMPGDDGIALRHDMTIRIAMPDRRPRLVFDGARYLQPRDAAATVALDVVNLSAVKLSLVRIGERNLLHVMQTYPPANGPIGSDGANDLAQNQGRVVWTGHAAVPDFHRNALQHVVLPLPPALAAPGLYALIAAPGDGTPFAQGDAPGAVQFVLRTDLAPTVWHGADGDLVQVRSFATGLPVAGAAIDLLASDNERLGHATTDADGVARFAQPLLAGQNGLAPAALHITGPGGDFTRLDLTAPDFDLSDRGVAGTPQPGPIDPFIWLDRGIYRPGETVQVMALLRNEAGAPVDLPLHLVVTRPDGRVFRDLVPDRSDDAAIHEAVTLSPGAPFGSWTVAVQEGPKAPPIASRSFLVDAFVPPRLAVSFDHLPPALDPGRTTDLPVAVRFLYGAPGSDLSGSGSVTLLPDPKPFDAFAAYHFGLAEEGFSGKTSEVTLATTDAAGATTLPVNLATLPDVSGALQAKLEATINDPAGRSVAATAQLPIRPAAPMIGIAEDFSGDSVNANTPAGFRLIAVAPDGKRVAMPVQLRLVRQVPDWRLAVKAGQARYETVWRDEPVDARSITLPADGAPYAYTETLPFGRYRLQVLQATGGLAASSVIFYSGWATSDNPDVPPRVSVRAERKTYAPGDTARIHVEAPFAGPATVLVMTDRVRRVIDLPAAGTSFDVHVPVGADWGPGAYVGVHVFRPGGADGRIAPDRAIGLTWVALDPKPRTLPLAIEAAPLDRPRTTATITIRTAPGAYVTLAAVDEGILSLTDFATPDPLQHFFGQRSLGVGIHDDFARLLPPAGAANTLLREGGGGEEEAPATNIPQKIVALFAGPVQAGPDGVARIPLALPDFDGQLRLMAVGWQGDRSNSAAQDITTRDRLIAEPLLPRFLAPGDLARAGILLQNLELPPGTVTLHLAASGTIALVDGDPAPVTLAAGQRTVVPVALAASGTGPGTLTLAVDGPGGFHAAHSATIGVHPARGTTTRVAALSLAPGATRTLSPDAGGFVPGSWHASVSFGRGVRYDPQALVRALEAYPLDCLEQLVSRGLPLAMLRGLAAGPDRAGKLEQTTEAVLDRQRYDGSFGLWSSTGEAQPWLSAYATDFLLRARAAGAVVPASTIASALTWLSQEVATPPDDAKARAAQAYALYVLALAGEAPAGAIRVAATGPADEPTPLARAQLAASLARLGQDEQARALFDAVLAEPAREDWSADYGSALRDQLAIAVLAQESGVMQAALPSIRARLPGADLDPATLDTQEQAWAGAAAAAMGEGAAPVSVVAGGRTLGPAPVISLALQGRLAVRNPGTEPLPASLVVQGVPVRAPPAARAGMEVHRHFYRLDGTEFGPDKLAQNTSFVLVIDGRATDGQAHRAMVLAGLPAGWEIAGRLGPGKVPGMDWLGTLSDTESQVAADDRYAAALDLSADQPGFRLAVILRAVTPGEFEYPGITVADMYRPAVFARQGSVRITVLPAGEAPSTTP
ncbi:MAG TPA: alpha-2-macroglobulin [Acetobacteraceae bacterium]|nr:alpha-2-macroglobulin [Acetobacteraceae bacterium]